jgi:pimeloyl-ACP methyl ester carboxylesterase
MAILDALDSVLPSTGILAPLILAGHDRGARICHRLGVDARLHEDRFEIVGTIFLDIVPTLVQWQTFSSPSASTGSFHWPLLANVKVATAMILAQGGDVWTSTCLERWVGKGETGLVKFKENNAMEIYCKFFKNESVVKATCDDYRAGAEEDVQLQESDQKSGAKLDVPVLAVYSANYLGKRYDVRKVWEEWMGYGKVEVLGIGERCGHFIAEEAPEKTAEAIAEFYFGHP